ncbi:MAG: cytochrome P450 [Actinomycetota bacterium]|nr:cytochrome P450 [Actinomycetota bacterium]
MQNLSWFFRPIQFIERCRARYGRVFTVRLGPDRNVVVVAEPDLARQLISGPADVYRAGDANGILRPVVGPSSLLVLDGDKHMRHRRILLPAFNATHAAGFARVVEEIASARVSRWRAGDELALQREMEQISFEAIIRVALGSEPEARLSRFRELVPEMMRRCASPFTILPYFRRQLGGITPYARLHRVLDELDGLFFAAIRERRRDERQGGDALSLLVAATGEDGEELSDSDIRDELLTLIMAGYETTTNALAWSFERLLRSPAALEHLLETLADDDETYLDAVVMEALRMRPVVPVVARKVSRDVTLGPYAVPAGTVLMASIYLLHRDPLLFEDPDEFRPERFLEGDHRGGAWVPFGGGVRRCLGASFAQLEMKVVLRTVLGNVRLRAPDQLPEPVKRKRFTFAPGREARAIVEATGPTAA